MRQRPPSARACTGPHRQQAEHAMQLNMQPRGPCQAPRRASWQPCCPRGRTALGGRSEGARSTHGAAESERVGASLRELALPERLFGAHTREPTDWEISRTPKTSLVL